MVTGPSVDEGVRTMLLLMPRLVGRAKRLPVPASLKDFSLAPRHLSLLSYLLFDGPLGVTDLATRLEVAPTTVSLMVGDLSRSGIVERHEDETDRRRAIVSIAERYRADVERWLASGAQAWQKVLEPLSPEQRRTVIETLQAYEREVASPDRDRQ